MDPQGWPEPSDPSDPSQDSREVDENTLFPAASYGEAGMDLRESFSESWVQALHRATDALKLAECT